MFSCHVYFSLIYKFGKLIFFSFKDIKMRKSEMTHTKDDVSKCQKDKCLNGKVEWGNAIFFFS